MQLFFLLKIGVELSQTLKREFVSQPDELRIWHVLLLEVTNLHWVGCTEHADLLLRLHKLNNLLYNVSEVI